MPRPKKLIPDYRKHRASGQAVVTLNGRDYYLGPHGTKVSKLEYDRIVAEWLASGRSPGFGASLEEVTIVELIADYVAFAKTYYGTGRTSEYHRLVRIMKLLRSLYGRTPAASFGVKEFKAVRQQLMNGDLCRSYVNQTMQKVVALFKWAAAEGTIAASVPQNLSMVPGLRKGKCGLREADPVVPVEDAVVATTLPYVPAVVADMIQIQRLTAMRPAEICVMRPIDVNRSGDVWVYRPPHHKTTHHGKERAIPIGPKAQRLLLPYLDRDAEAYCFRPCESESKRRAARHAVRKTPLSCGNKPGSNRKSQPKRTAGDCYTADSYRRAIHRACDQAFPHPTLSGTHAVDLSAAESEALREWRRARRWAPNQLRHAAATEVRAKFGLEQAQVILGHAHARITEVYAERDLKKGIEVARALG
jgi:integrase